MKVKKRNLIELILQSIAFILLFVNKSFVDEAWYYDGFRGSSKVKEEFFSFFQKIGDEQSIVGYITIALFIVGIVVFIIQYVSKGNKRNSLFAAVMPVIEIVMLIVSAITLYSEDSVSTNYDPLSGYLNYHYDYYTKPVMMFYICGAVLLVLALISIIGYSKAKKDGIEEEIVKVKVVTNETSNADELKKYKELLDSGIITQEEFEEKKKQLLGL